MGPDLSRKTPVCGLIIAAPSSGSGKTVVTLGLLAALKARGIKVASFKTGPDYIDPAFHAKATGRPCFNLDPWAMRPETLSASVNEVGLDIELVVAEGVMGLFDGATLDLGSTADLAALTGWPIVLVVDARSQGASAAAQVLGFDRFRSDINIAGVIFNRVGSEKHQNVIRAAMRRVLPEIPVLGMIPWEHELELPSRHLGLIQAAEQDGLKSIIDEAAQCMEKHVDVGTVHDLATDWHASGQVQPLPPLGQHIAVAQDEAFAFAYPAMLQGWRNQGVELSFFSPLDDQAPAAHADAVFLPGGYPELHGYRLSSAEKFVFGLQKAARDGKVIYGECGGYMVLGDAIVDAEGQSHAMLGLLPLQTSFAKRKLHLGYRQLVLQTDTPLGKAGAKFRGHEFHYASIIDKGLAANLFDAADAEGLSLGPIGLQVMNVFGSFAHVVDTA